MIKDYLHELIGELDLPARRRRRVVAEVEDHLSSSAADLQAAGLDVASAEREAIARFGPARELAQTFLEDAAAAAGRSVGRAAVMLTVLLLLAVADPPGLLTWNNAPFAARGLSFVFGQIALVAGGLTLMRIWRASSTRGPRGVRLVLVLRGAQVVLGCAIVTLGCGIALAVSHPSETPTRVWVALGVLGVGILAAAAVVWRTRRRAVVAGVDQNAAPSVDEDALSDLAVIGSVTLARVERRVGVVARVRAVLARWLSELSRRAPWLVSLLDLRHHPWRFACTFAAAAGLALAVGHGVSEGGPPSAVDVPRAILAGLIVMSVETGAILLSFLALGRFLGIRAR